MESRAATELVPLMWTRIIFVLRLHLKLETQQCGRSLSGSLWPPASVFGGSENSTAPVCFDKSGPLPGLSALTVCLTACCFLSFMSHEEEFKMTADNENPATTRSTLPPLQTTGYTTKRTPVFVVTAGMTNAHEHTRVFFGGIGCRTERRRDREGTGRGCVQNLLKLLSFLPFLQSYQPNCR